MTNAALPTNRQPRYPVQERSRKRFDAVLDITDQLIEEHSLETISLLEIASRAGIPPASLYHFFPTVDSVFTALADRYRKALVVEAKQPLPPEALADWQSLIHSGYARGRQFYANHPVATELLLGASGPRTIQTGNYEADVAIGKLMSAGLKHYFNVTFVPDLTHLSVIGVTISDAIWSLSVRNEGSITDEYFEESQRVLLAYYGRVIPPDLRA